MASKAPTFPGYAPISNRIFIRNETSSSDLENARSKTTANDPTTILIYGWGDGSPRHVAKYSEGYHALFPSARIVVIINPIFAATTQLLPQRTEAMRPLIDTCFPTKDDGSERVIMHIMSNTGGIYAAATLNAYRERHGQDAALPHHLCVSDSTPGSLNFTSEVWRWSRAMAMGVPKWFPLPFKFTQALCAAFLSLMNYLAIAVGIEPSGVHSARIFTEHGYATPKALRLFCYSKEDDLIHWEDLEEQAANARNKGYSTVLEEFKGSPHVGHMRMHPEQYWATILRCWKQAMAMDEKA
ncbi:hypothetical protein F5B22DRAFT_576857 [Xylaria bambusicola]|uniref:uncharacterized protein n=1 Tax=Xylaria bambusicola TaxID=326684 RepID=UPI002007C5C9|nr:uncharacterized protein F5B22DRAFT_576857 [Xylaria bambusicola]KAI0503033.1 hypothetical protein F5B22DRAFT_576857 [Xylaria bambusicola]